MKLQFEANLHYQEQAVSSVVDLFRGQTPRQSGFTITNYSDQGTMFTDNGVGNRLELGEDEILENLQAVQLRNGLPQTKTIKKDAYDFDIEMETGTGKTYVYLRTIFELNKAYGFKKFIMRDNPDWAIVIEDDGLNKLYFVVETKGSIEGKDLRPKEQAKIRCGEKHFAALGNEAKFMKADSFQRFTEHAL